MIWTFSHSNLLHNYDNQYYYGHDSFMRETGKVMYACMKSCCLIEPRLIYELVLQAKSFDKYEWIYLPTDREGLVCLVAWLFVGLTRRTPHNFYIANYYHALKVPNEHCFGDVRVRKRFERNTYFKKWLDSRITVIRTEVGSLWLNELRARKSGGEQTHLPTTHFFELSKIS